MTILIDMPDMPDDLKRTPEKHTASTNAWRDAAERRRAQAANLKPDLKTSQPKPGSKLANLRALREEAAANAERAQKTEAKSMLAPGAAAGKAAQVKPLNWNEGTAKARHAYYSVVVDDGTEGDGQRRYIINRVTGEGSIKIGTYFDANESKTAAANDHAELAKAGAPIYKPAKEPKADKVKADQKESVMSAKKKPAKAAKKAKAKKAPAPKKAKGAAKANARKAVKGTTSARKPREAGAPSKKDLTISRLKARWTSAAELAKELGWLPHTFRGFLSGLRNPKVEGAVAYNVETDRREDGTYYRIV